MEFEGENWGALQRQSEIDSKNKKSGLHKYGMGEAICKVSEKGPGGAADHKVLVKLRGCCCVKRTQCSDSA